MGHLIWKSVKKPGVCTLLAPHGLTDPWELERGISRAAGWSPDAYCKMNDRYPKDIALADNMHATGLTVVSRAMKEFLLGADVKDVEFLPLTIINHKGKVAAADYSIVNPIGVIDCIDTKASGATWNDLEPDLMLGCDSLMIQAKKVPATATVFRPKYMPTIILVEGDLTKRMAAAGFSGLNFKKPESFTGI